MERDDLIRLLSSLPAHADVGIRLGNQHLGIAELQPWGEDAFAALVCDTADLRDVLKDWLGIAGPEPGRVKREELSTGHSPGRP